MAEYEVTYHFPLDDAWESGTHVFPSFVEVRAHGVRGAPDATIRCELRDGVPEVVDLHLVAKEGGRAVRSADLNAFMPLEGVALNSFRSHARRKDPGTRSSFGPADEREFWELGGTLADAQASRRGPSRAELEQVASVYRSAINSRPTMAVQIQMGYTRRTAARRVQQARAAGLLPDTTAGMKKA